MLKEAPPPAPPGPPVRVVRDFDMGFLGWVWLALFLGSPIAAGLALGFML